MELLRCRFRATSKEVIKSNYIVHKLKLPISGVATPLQNAFGSITKEKLPHCKIIKPSDQVFQSSRQPGKSQHFILSSAFFPLKYLHSFIPLHSKELFF